MYIFLRFRGGAGCDVERCRGPVGDKRGAAAPCNRYIYLYLYVYILIRCTTQLCMCSVCTTVYNKYIQLYITYVNNIPIVYVSEPIAHPERFQCLGLEVPAGVLFFGPPGCGELYTISTRSCILILYMLYCIIYVLILL